MRVAFDIDGTLTPLGRGQFASTVPAFPLKLAFREPLRNGAIELKSKGPAPIWIGQSGPAHFSREAGSR